MSHVSNIYTCPACVSDITSDKEATECPECGFPLGDQGIADYAIPITFSEQHTKLGDKQLYLDTLRNLPASKTMYVLNDALNVMELIAGKKDTINDIRLMLDLGIRVGELAKQYKAYLDNGGRHVPHLELTYRNAKEQQKGDDDEPSKEDGK